jgi:membrane-associated phospholipid phosphatase
MRAKWIVLTTLSLLGATGQQLQAQAPKFDSVTYKRAHKPLLRWGEVIGVAATTGIAVALDKSLRKDFADSAAGFGHTVTRLGNAQGSVFVYPTLLAFAVAGKLLPSKGMYGVASRALKSVIVGGAVGMVLKFGVGRVRPNASPDDQLKFHPVTIKDNSWPSGHTTVAFALATSFARETHNKIFDVAFFSLASLTAYSRLHDNKHWTSDVVSGAGLGILAARFVHRREARILLQAMPGGVGGSFEF